MAGTSIPRTVLYGIDGKPLDLRRGWVVQTIVPVTSAGVLIVPENPDRLGLAWMVMGASNVCIKPLAKGEVFAVFPYGQGRIYQANGTDDQGASEDFSGMAPCNGFSAVCKVNQSSTLIVWESVNG